MMVVVMASEQGAGTARTVYASFPSEEPPRMIAATAAADASAKHVIQEDRSVLELLHAGQMVHQLRREGLHIGIEVLLDPFPLARLVERNDGRREEEHQTPDDGQKQRGRLPIPKDFLGVFVLPGGARVARVLAVARAMVLAVQGPMLVPVGAIFPAFLLPVALLMARLGPRQLRQIHIQIPDRPANRVHVLLTGPQDQLLLTTNRTWIALFPFQIPPPIRITHRFRPG